LESFLIEGEKRRYSVCKMYFIIWSYENGPVRVEKTNPLLKTYTHSFEALSDETIAFEIATGSRREPSQ